MSWYIAHEKEAAEQPLRKKYNNLVKEEIKKLCSKKDKLFIDLHIHSNYSADGKQNLNQILQTTKEKGFDVIAITDHDSLDVYDELYNIVSKKLTYPLVIPGIEFTIDSKEYGNQCHLLQLFINPKDQIIQKDVLNNYKAMFNRSKKQFERLKQNLAIQELIKSNNIYLSYNEYKKYLSKNEYVPEYDTLCSYLIEKFKKKGITTFNILDKLEKYNKEDCFEDRKDYKARRYAKLRDKYSINDNNKYNGRFLLSMLAVREVDDDWWPKPACGSLSVNSYGQLKIDEINNKYDIYFAHPTEKSLNVVDKIVKSKKNIKGLELNIRNDYMNIESFYKILKENKLIEIKGSDSHDASLQFYKNMNFFMIDSKEFEKIVH